MKTFRLLQKELSLFGPFFLLTSLALLANQAIPLDLFCVTLLGFFLASLFHVRGFCYASIFLALDGIFRHWNLESGHLWLLGVETSIGLAFFIIALCFEEKTKLFDSLKSQVQSASFSIAHLEEEALKQHDSALEDKLSLERRKEEIQKMFDELEIEHSSVLVLNEVLRKKTAQYEALSKESKDLLLAKEHQQKGLEEEIVALNEELKRLKDTQEMARLNCELMADLNQAKVAKEQTFLFNQTLERLLASEKYKRKEAEEERDAIKELRRKAPLYKADSELLEESEFLKKKVEELKNFEHLYQQIKAQFEEKKRTLKETRKELFQRETELEAMKITQKEQLDEEHAAELEHKLIQAEEKVALLEEENALLEEVLSQVSKGVKKSSDLLSS